MRIDENIVAVMSAKHSFATIIFVNITVIREHNIFFVAYSLNNEYHDIHFLGTFKVLNKSIGVHEIVLQEIKYFYSKNTNRRSSKDLKKKM